MQHLCYSRRSRWLAMRRPLSLLSSLFTYDAIHIMGHVLKSRDVPPNLSFINWYETYKQKLHARLIITIFLAWVKLWKYESDAKASSFRFCKMAYWKYYFLGKERTCDLLREKLKQSVTFLKWKELKEHEQMFNNNDCNLICWYPLSGEFFKRMSCRSELILP